MQQDAGTGEDGSSRRTCCIKVAPIIPHLKNKEHQDIKMRNCDRVLNKYVHQML